MSQSPPGTGRRPDGAAFFIALALAATGALLIWDAHGIPDMGGYSGVGPGDIPRLIGWCLVGLGLWTALDGWRGGSGPRPPQNLVPVFWIVGGLALQLVLLKPLGFSIASGILFACTASAFARPRLALSLPVGIGFAFVIYGIFDRLLQLNLPAGLPETLIYGG